MAQSLAGYRWYFGNSSQAIVFSQSDREALLIDGQYIPFGTGGSAVATNPITGSLLFYSDGEVVVDAGNTPMPNGGGLTGNAALNQGVAVAPVPGAGNETQYYVFYTDGTNLTYSIVDMAATGNASAGNLPSGDVTVKNQLLLAGVGETLLVVPNSDFTGSWLITQNGAGEYVVITIAETNNLAVQTYPLAGAPVNATTPAAHLALNSSGNRIAVAPRNGNTNIQLLTFNRTSGAVGYVRPVFNTGFTAANAENTAVYDVAFSPGGDFLYLSRTGESGTQANVYRMDLNNNSALPVALLENPVARSYGLQEAPDGNLYHLYRETGSGPYLTGRFSQLDSIADVVEYEEALFRRQDFAGSQFPSFLPTYRITAGLDFTFFDVCLGNETKFVAFSEPPAKEYRWEMISADGADTINVTNVQPRVEFPASGDYQVTLTADYGGTTQTVTKTVTIQETQLQVMLNDTTVCPGDVLTLDAGAMGTYIWNTGETTQTIEASEAGTYWVEVTDAAGCSAYDEMELRIYGDTTAISTLWHFGDQAGLDFNENPPVPLLNSAMTAPEGCSVIAGPNGEMLFYTDGETVWDQSDNVMANGTNIGGDAGSTMSSIIVPFPDDETLFYIFTTQAVESGGHLLKYSIVDIKANSALGEVVEKDVNLFTKVTEKVVAFDGNGGGTTILAHEFGTNNFLSYSLSAEGITGPEVFSEGSVHTSANPAGGQGYMTVSPNGDLLAVSIPGNNPAVELFRIDSTGALSDVISIDVPSDPVYGIGFSPGGAKMYVSVPGSGAIYEYFVDTIGPGDEAYINQSIEELANNPGTEYGAIQIGPDNRVYVAQNNSGTLSVIEPNEDEETASVLTEDDQDLGGRQSTLGLPNYVQNQQAGTGLPDFTASNTCRGQEVLFSATPSSDIDTFFWNLGDGTTSTDQQLTHTYDEAGTYLVTLVVDNRCLPLGYEPYNVDSFVVQKEIVIYEEPQLEDLEAVICDDNGVLVDALPAGLPDEGLTYGWSTGDSTRTVIFDQVGDYTVTVTNEFGCATTVPVSISEGRPEVELPEDQFACRGTELGVIDSGISPNAPVTLQWFINGTPAGTSRTIQINETLDEATYRLEVTNTLTFCTVSDEVVIRLYDEPDPSLASINPGTCGNADGSIFINAPTDATATYVYQWLDENRTVVGNDMNLQNVDPGNYTLVVQNQTTGCTSQDVFTLEDASRSLDVSLAVNNCVAQVTVDNITGASAGAATYRVLDENGLEMATGGFTNLQPVTPATVDVPELTEGNYLFEINQGGCFFSDDFVVPAITRPTAFTYETPIDLCEPGLISIERQNPNLAVRWEEVTGQFADGASPNNASVGVQGSGTFRAIISDPSDPLVCDTTVLIDVNILEPPVPDFTVEGDECEGEIRLIPSPAGNYTYEWTINGQVEYVNELVLNEIRRYDVSLRVIDNASGCDAVTEDRPFNIREPLELELDAPYANCPNGEDVRIDALINREVETYDWTVNGESVAADSAVLFYPSGQGRLAISLTITTADGCTATSELTLSEAPFTPVTLPESAIICPLSDNLEEALIELDPQASFQYYEWYLDGELISRNQVLIADTEGTYTFVGTNLYNCPTTLEVDVIEDCSPEVDAPNAFRPGGTNREFFVFPRYVNEFEIYIYNRWGELIFFSDNQDFRWDGTFNGSLVPAGTYAYVIRFTGIREEFNEEQRKRGSITIIR
ncbi:PKD domain-containing protein [Roseivirga sp. BDSF3-8]|uniref:PKD domain-containing protein n=1 Tax=Roseivirga sp. BDSF3-8 TaxID=3241598 RepID=UPI003531E29B